MADKKLNITADLKVKTGDAERVLQKLSKEGVKISKILKDLDINTSGGRAGFAKSLITADKAMLKLRGTTQDTAKAMEHVYGRQLEKQGRQLELYTRKVERLNKIYKGHEFNREVARAVGNPFKEHLAQKGMDKASDKILIAEVARQAVKANMDELKAQGGGGGPGRLDKLAVAMGAGQATAGGIGSVAGAIQSTKTVGAMNLGNIRNYERQLLGRMIGGDFSDLHLMNRNVGKKRVGEYSKDEFGGRTAAKIESSAAVVESLMRGGGSILQMFGKGGAGFGAGAGGGVTRDIGNTVAGASGFTGAVRDMIITGKSRVLGGPELAEAQAQMQGLEALKAQDPFRTNTLDFIRSTSGMRVGAGKALQSRHMGAWGLGMGHGLDMGESFSTAMGLSRQFGVGATFDGGIMRGALGLESRGFDRGAAGSALGTILMGQGGNKTNANSETVQMLAIAFSRGLKDARLGEEILTGAAALAFGFGGATKDIGQVGAQLSGGLTSSSTLRDVQANIGGFNAVSGMLQQNPYFRAVGAESALKVLGRGATGTQMMAASKSSLAQLIGGSDMLEAAGITGEQRGAMVNDQLNSLMGAFLTNSNDPQTAKLRKALDSSGGNIINALRSGGGDLDKEFALALSSSSGIDFEQATGFARTIRGRNADRKEGDGFYGFKGDAVASGQTRAQQAVLNELFKEEQKIREEYLRDLKGAAATARAIKDNPAGFEASEKFFADFRKIMLDILTEVKRGGVRTSAAPAGN